MKIRSDFVDLTDRKFGRLTVLYHMTDSELTKKARRSIWMCRCECGKELPKLSNSLLRQNTKSCGCLRKDTLSKMRWKGHEGISGSYWTRLQKDAAKRDLIWDISVKDSWEMYVKQERKCAMSKLPIVFDNNLVNQTASLDRIDSDFGYINGNTQWLHKDINLLKWDWKISKLFELCELILSNKDQYLSKIEENSYV